MSTIIATYKGKIITYNYGFYWVNGDPCGSVEEARRVIDQL